MYTVADFFTSFFNSITELLLTKLFHYNPLIDNDYYSNCSFKKVMNNKNFFKKMKENVGISNPKSTQTRLELYLSNKIKITTSI